MRFGRTKLEKNTSNPCFDSDFVIEGYLDYQVNVCDTDPDNNEPTELETGADLGF